MKLKIFLLVSCFVFLAKANAQIIDNNLKAPANATFKQPIQITQIDLISDSSKPDGNGHKIYFNALITSTGAGTVNYQWILRGSNGPAGSPPPTTVINGTLKLSGTGTDHVYHTASYGSHGLITIQLKTTTPVAAASPIVSY